MEKINISMQGGKIDFELARRLSLTIASQDDEEPMLICWNDKVNGNHSPSGVQCEIKGLPGWEVYGENHGGRLRISINSDDFVFIYA